MDGTPPVTLLGEVQAQLDSLAGAHLLRQRPVVQAVRGPHLQQAGQDLLGFCSNDYLGLAQHPALIAAAQAAAAEHGVGACASPLVCGHSSSHEALEHELAEFVGMPRALYFGSGYLANVGIVPAWVGQGDAVFSDALNHACLIDGIRLSKASAHVYPHADMDSLESLLTACTARRKLVVTDAVFSMDGDLAPLHQLLALCEQYDAWLMVDDAHGLGVLGPQGRGTAAHLGLRSERLIYMATLGKAAGCAGAFVAGETQVIEWLMQRARTYIFATATPAMVVQAARASLKVMQTENWRRTHLGHLIEHLQAGLSRLPWKHAASLTAIQPLILGRNESALQAMHLLHRQGLWVPAIRPPTVPEGTARLRISLSAAHSESDITRLLLGLEEVALTLSASPA